MIAGFGQTDHKTKNVLILVKDRILHLRSKQTKNATTVDYFTKKAT